MMTISRHPLKRTRRLAVVVAATLAAGLVAAANPSPSAAQNPDAGEPSWLEVINAWRTAYGVDEVTLDPALNQGAEDHSCYVLSNRGKDWWTGDDYHTQRPDAEGYSEAGKKASIGPQGPAFPDEPIRLPMESFFSALIHAEDVFHPQNKSVGFGKCNLDGDGDGEEESWFTIDTRANRSDTRSWPASEDVMVFPPPGTTWNFVTAATEIPDPTLACANPQIRLDNEIGVPAMVTFQHPIVGPVSATYESAGKRLDDADVCVLSHLDADPWDGDVYKVLVFPRSIDVGVQTVTVTTGYGTVEWSFNVPFARTQKDFDLDDAVGDLPASYTPPIVRQAHRPTGRPYPESNFSRSIPTAARSNFVAVEPFRFADSRSRPDNPPLRAVRLDPNAESDQRIQIAGIADVPASIAAVSANFTVVNMAAGGYLTVYDCGDERPVVSTVNFVPGGAVANQAIVPTDAAGGICVYSNVATHMIVDVNGYFTTADGDRFTGIASTRVYDSRERNADGSRKNRRLAERTERAVPVTSGGFGVPRRAEAVSVVVTAADTRAPGWLRLYPCDQADDSQVSNVNYRAFDTRANAAIVKLADNGTVCAESSTDIEFVVDVNGYFSESGSQFVPITPFRLIDTRGKEKDEKRIPELSVSWQPYTTVDTGLPDAAVGISGNITAVNAATGGFLTANVSCPTELPRTSNVNVRPPNLTAAAALLTPLAPEPAAGERTPGELDRGELCIFNRMPTHILVDLNGFWIDSAPTATTERSSESSSKASTTSDSTSTSKSTSDSASTSTASLSVSASSALSVLDSLAVAAEQPGGYDRDLFSHWSTQPSGCNTRVRVLLDETRSAVERNGCRVSSGSWISLYDNVAVSDPSQLDIDHMVPLAEAWASGAYAWSASERKAFANDVGDARSLRAVTARTNRSKGAKDPASWIPPHGGALCTYLSDWVAVKARWSLTVDTAERDRIRDLLTDRCSNQTTSTNQAPTPQPPTPQPPPPQPPPPPPPPPTPTPTPEQSTSAGSTSCDRSYPDVCIPPSPPDLNCGDVSYRNFTVLPPDPHRFDGNKDGIGCTG